MSLSAADWATWAQAIASVANLLLVFWLFIWADRKHRCERHQDFTDRESERKAQVAAFWIEELIMRPHHAFIQKFFDDYESRLKAETNGIGKNEEIISRASAEIQLFKAEYHKLRCRVIEPLQWVHNDFSELLQILGQIEDLVTTEISRIPGVIKTEADSQKKCPSDRLAELRRQFFQTIHKIQTNVILISPEKISK
ncbi:MAG TPA: hypothetical protein VHY30_04320 [Verrucomicrobiae bacterium]|nr:hypothetical protein [Verrucomicrobiae bacterium]